MPRIVVNQGISPSPIYVRKAKRPLLKLFWGLIGFLLLAAVSLMRAPAFESVVASGLIAIAALIPIYLWCSERVKGIPIFPIFALTYLWTFALPLITDHPAVITYSPMRHLIAGATVAGFLGLATIIWVRILTSPEKPPSSYRILEGETSDWILLFSFIISDLFLMGNVGGWFNIEGGVLSLLRGIIFGISTLATFVLAYKLGQRELSQAKTATFLILLVISIVVSSASLFLIGALSTTGLAGAGFILGRQRVPWLALLLAFSCLIIFHSGKEAMREKYWSGEQSSAIQPWDYPAWFAEWAGNAVQALFDPSSVSGSQTGSFSERMSLIHLLLMVQDKSPNEVPYLFGATYAGIPESLAPRFLFPDKPRSHEGGDLLSVHYGLLNEEGTLKTSIGWGLMNEANANFGYFGCAGLAIILGCFYGFVTRWSRGLSLLSSRALFGILVLSIAYQAEFSAGVYVTVMFQQSVPLIALTMILMKIKVSSNIAPQGLKAEIKNQPLTGEANTDAAKSIF